MPFRSSILRWTPEAKEEITENGAIQCSVMIVAIGQAATSNTSIQYVVKLDYQTIIISSEH